MKREEILILWDASHFWGLMALRGFGSLGYKRRLVKAKDIAQGGVLGKRVRALVIPGGNARLKAEALGAKGLDNARRFVREGGLYIGFCGGAGLGLRQPDGLGANLCPWERGAYARRLFHLISGYVRVGVGNGETLNLPVWWPGRFAESPDPSIEVVARYEAPSDDLWIGDAPFSKIPRSDSPLTSYRFPSGEPLVIKGKYGEGAYILSYAHLETPASEDANSLLKSLIEGKTQRATIPQWNVLPAFQNILGRSGSEKTRSEMEAAYALMAELAATGERAGLFQVRAPWLMGWRSGAPGIACNSFLAILSEAATVDLSEEARAYWQATRSRFWRAFDVFRGEAAEYLKNLRFVAERDGGTRIIDDFPETREKLFGSPALGGGLIGELSSVGEELIYLSQPDNDAD